LSIRAVRLTPESAKTAFGFGNPQLVPRYILPAAAQTAMRAHREQSEKVDTMKSIKSSATWIELTKEAGASGLLMEHANE
jgi:hypothetical protein